MRRRLSRVLLGVDVVTRIEALETRMYETREEAWERSRERWRAVQPNVHLTWARELTGEAFVDKLAEYGALGPTRRLVEIGPGYGRLLTSCLAREGSFASYLGVDLSPENVNHLRARFGNPAIEFVNADVESVDFGPSADTVFSSLTFKHLFGSFAPAVENIARQLSPGGLLVIDLIEGHRRYFEDDGLTYIRWYSRAEVTAILEAGGLRLVAFDEVRHVPEVIRLLVVATRPRKR
jgi:SAM-dependent methyltransferase